LIVPVKALANAGGAAEVLEARDLASIAYDAAKKAGRLARAKGAHDDLIAAAYRTQADALEIEALAKRRLADEYDAAQERDEIASSGDTLRQGPSVPKQNSGKATAADVGLNRKEIHEARAIRNAETAEPGIIARALDQMVGQGRADQSKPEHPGFQFLLIAGAAEITITRRRSDFPASRPIRAVHQHFRSRKHATGSRFNLIEIVSIFRSRE
jgi:hypothetical protein